MHIPGMKDRDRMTDDERHADNVAIAAEQVQEAARRSGFPLHLDIALTLQAVAKRMESGDWKLSTDTGR